MSEVIIRKGTKDDIKTIAKIYDDFLDYEAEHGTMTNWIKGVYPTEKNALKGLDENSLFVGEIDGKIIGSYILNSHQPAEYKKLDWKWEAEDNEVLVIHTLCLDINLQSKGIGKTFVDYAIKYGQDNGYKVIRLDTYEKNEKAARLYEKLNFRYVGNEEFLFEGQILENLICFEYLL